MEVAGAGGRSRGYIKHTHLVILLCILSDPRCHPVALISSIPSRIDSVGTSLMNSMPWHMPMIGRRPSNSSLAFRSPIVSAPFRILRGRSPLYTRTPCPSVYAYVNGSNESVVKHFDFKQRATMISRRMLSENTNIESVFRAAFLMKISKLVWRTNRVSLFIAAVSEFPSSRIRLVTPCLYLWLNKLARRDRTDSQLRSSARFHRVPLVFHVTGRARCPVEISRFHVSSVKSIIPVCISRGASS